MLNTNISSINESSLAYTAQILNDLHSVFTPHDGQIPIGRALFYENKKFIFLECGRKFGKSELLIYCLYRFALSRPNSACYYIAPFAKQAKELIWANNRIQNFLVKNGDISLYKKYITAINNTEMRVTFFNNSFIKLDGADNYEAYRGINPHIIAYDEFKDHNPKFHEGMEPNLATYKAPCIFVGTPPENEFNHFIYMAESVKNDQEDGAYFCMPTSINPHIDKKWLEKTKTRLFARGEADVWFREYEAKRIKGGKNAIFPMFDRKTHVIDQESVIGQIKRYYKDYDLYCTFDPATASVFAVLFSAINKRTRVVYHIDCIYESNTLETSTRKIWRRARDIAVSIAPISMWNFVYDEAAAWFCNELLDISDDELSIFPTHKASNKKEFGLSLIKDQMLYGLWYCTNRCEKLMIEIENYTRDDNNKIPKKDDHLIDCMRYVNSANNYTQIPIKNDENKDDVAARYTTIYDELKYCYSDDTNWEHSILQEKYLDYYDIGIEED